MNIINPYRFGSAPEFVMTIDTTLSGSASDTYILPFRNLGTYDCTVYWGDGNSDYINTWNDPVLTHVYAVSGIYQIIIEGKFGQIYNNNTGDNRKVISLDQWGTNEWDAFDSSFYGCVNMLANYSDYPNVSNCTSGQNMFNFCRAFNGRIDQMDFSNFTTMRGALATCDNFNNAGNSGFANMSFPNVTSFQDCFKNNYVLNQPVDNWVLNTASGITMRSMFQSCNALDQDFGNWNIEKVTSLLSFLHGGSAGLSTANYNATLIGWTGWSGGVPTKSVRSAVSCRMGSSTYTLGSDAEDARTYLDVDKSWVILDGGGI